MVGDGDGVNVEKMLQTQREEASRGRTAETGEGQS